MDGLGHLNKKAHVYKNLSGMQKYIRPAFRSYKLSLLTEPYRRSLQFQIRPQNRPSSSFKGFNPH